MKKNKIALKTIPTNNRCSNCTAEQTCMVDMGSTCRWGA